MLNAIIYKTNTGHTLEYAKMLSKDLDIPAYDIKELKKFKECLKIDDEIIYMGWVCAGRISGLTKINNGYKIVCTIAVGAYPDSKKNFETLRIGNNINDNNKLFYIRGGINLEKLNPLLKKIFKIVGRKLEKSDKEYNRELANMFIKGKSFVRKENLDKIEKYLKKIKDK